MPDPKLRSFRRILFANVGHGSVVCPVYHELLDMQNPHVHNLDLVAIPRWFQWEFGSNG